MRGTRVCSEIMGLHVRWDWRVRQGALAAWLWLGCALALAGCGTSGGQARPDRPASLEVTVEDGPYAGTHTAETAERVCVPGMVGPGTWGVQYARPGAESGLSSLQLVWESKREWYLGALFGPIGGGTDAHYEIETRPRAKRRGTGTLNLETVLEGAILRARGITAEGVALSVTVRCPVDSTGLDAVERR